MNPATMRTQQRPVIQCTVHLRSDSSTQATPPLSRDEQVVQQAKLIEAKRVVEQHQQTTRAAIQQTKQGVKKSLSELPNDITSIPQKLKALPNTPRECAKVIDQVSDICIKCLNAYQSEGDVEFQGENKAGWDTLKKTGTTYKSEIQKQTEIFEALLKRRIRHVQGDLAVAISLADIEQKFAPNNPERKPKLVRTNGRINMNSDTNIALVNTFSQAIYSTMEQHHLFSGTTKSMGDVLKEHSSKWSQLFRHITQNPNGRKEDISKFKKMKDLLEIVYKVIDAIPGTVTQEEYIMQ